MGDTRSTAWEPLSAECLPLVDAIGSSAHPGLPESIDVLTEKLAIFPEGCLGLFGGGRLLGYGLAHPWTVGSIPALDRRLGHLPAKPDCLYVHDVVVRQEARGGGASTRLYDIYVALALRHGLGAMACVSVYGTDRLWSRFGFVERPGIDVGTAAAGYGPTARYLVNHLTA